MKPSGNEKFGRAFTLVELLVVISVIALLMAILVPALGKAQATANRTYCMANMNQLGIAMRSYLDDNRDIFPLCCATPWENPNANSPGYAPPITKVLGKILKEPKVFVCKADTKAAPPYHLRTGNTSYWYNGVTTAAPFWLAGITIRQFPLVRAGAKEKDIEVMSDFDAIHPVVIYDERTQKMIRISKNYLYADWHVSTYVKQE